MYQLLLIGLIGEQKFMDIFCGLKHDFFKLPRDAQDGLWGAVINLVDGDVTEIRDLVRFANNWIDLYGQVKASVHKAIENL